MPIHLCSACATSFAPAAHPPASCPICRDERQFVPPSGQKWTTAEAVDAGHRGVLAYDGPLLGVGMTPSFAIGQRALLLRTPSGNVLWDCIPFLDRALFDIVEALGGLEAIAISHPHYYGRMEDWSSAFGGVPVHCHADDRRWAMNPGPNARFWAGERHDLLPGLTLVRCGGHFAGGTVLHVEPGASRIASATKSLAGFHAAGRKGQGPDGPAAASPRIGGAYAAGQRHAPTDYSDDPLPLGALLSGDILQVTPGGTHLSFMRSYPNMIPLGAGPVRRIAEALADLEFDAVLGAFWGRVIATGGKAALAASVERYLAWVTAAASDDREMDPP